MLNNVCRCRLQCGEGGNIWFFGLSAFEHLYFIYIYLTKEIVAKVPCKTGADCTIGRIVGRITCTTTAFTITNNNKN